MEMMPINSRTMLTVGYESGSKKMKIKFRQGESHTFCQVPQNVFDAFLAAASKDHFYEIHIKTMYQWY